MSGLEESKGSIDSQISFVYHDSTRILHSGSALAFQARGAGSIPAIRSLLSSSWSEARMTFTFCVKKCQIWFFFQEKRVEPLIIEIWRA